MGAQIITKFTVTIELNVVQNQNRDHPIDYIILFKTHKFSI